MVYLSGFVDSLACMKCGFARSFSFISSIIYQPIIKGCFAHVHRGTNMEKISQPSFPCLLLKLAN